MPEERGRLERDVIERTRIFQSDIIARAVKSRHIDFNEGIPLQERATDPEDPADGESVIWMSDGSGSGDDGDIMIKINVGGTVKTGTIIDYSAI